MMLSETSRVFGTGAGWPDVIVAAVMAMLALQGAATVIRQARSELRSDGSMTPGTLHVLLRSDGGRVASVDKRR